MLLAINTVDTSLNCHSFKNKFDLMNVMVTLLQAFVTSGGHLTTFIPYREVPVNRSQCSPGIAIISPCSETSVSYTNRSGAHVIQTYSCYK